MQLGNCLAQNTSKIQVIKSGWKRKMKEEKCNICDSPIEEDNGDIIGNFGIYPVAFCVWCLSSMTDMVIQLNGFNEIETLEERIQDIKNDM